MADVVEEEEEWLYGENAEDQIKIDPDAANKLLEDDNEDDASDRKNDAEEIVAETTGDGDASNDGPESESKNDNEQPKDGPNASDEEDVDDEDNDDDDDSDDDGVQVVIGDLKSGAPGSFGAASKRGGPPPDKKGKFAVEDFETPGTINGVPALELSVDSLEEKPWRKPGADITDYFNYGFTEDTWRAYCDRQKRLRFESGAGLANPIAKMHGEGGEPGKIGPQSNISFPKKFGQQPYQRMPMKQELHENTIQVRVVNTVDRRDNFGRKGYDMPPPMGPPPFNLSVPPPPFRPEYMGQPPPEFFNRPPPGYYPDQEMPGYEEQQWMDSQWEMGGPGMGPSSSVSLVPLTKVPIVPPPPGEADDNPSKDGAK